MMLLYPKYTTLSHLLPPTAWNPLLAKLIFPTIRKAAILYHFAILARDITNIVRDKYNHNTQNTFKNHLLLL